MAQNIMLWMGKALIKGKLNPKALTGLERFMLAQLTIPDWVLTMLGMSNVVKALEDAGLRKNVEVIIGGARVLQQFAENIHAHAYAANAPQGFVRPTGAAKPTHVANSTPIRPAP